MLNLYLISKISSQHIAVKKIIFFKCPKTFFSKPAEQFKEFFNRLIQRFLLLMKMNGKQTEKQTKLYP